LIVRISEDRSYSARSRDEAGRQIAVVYRPLAAHGVEDPAATLPSAPAGPPVRRVGELWLLGRHRIFCGSALDDSAYSALMRGARAAAIFIDPPYNVASKATSAASARFSTMKL
jgi:hypothetical protein